MPLPIRLGLLLLAAVIALYTLELGFGLLPEDYSDPAQKVATNVAFLGAALLCGLRALRRGERGTWLMFATGLLLWGLGDVYYALVLWGLEETPIPSPADIGYLGLYPPMYAGLVLLLRSRVRGAHATFWVDGLIGALAVGALAAAFVFHAVLQGTGGSPATIATNLAYPLADLLLGGLVVGVLSVTGWRLNSAWAWLATGLAVFAITDSLYLYRTATGTYESTALFDFGWPLAALMIATAAWWPTDRKGPRVGPYRTTLWPAAFSTLALGVLVYDHFERVNLLALVLATASMVAVVARLTPHLRPELAPARRSSLGRDDRLTDRAGQPSPSAGGPRDGAGGSHARGAAGAHGARPQRVQALQRHVRAPRGGRPADAPGRSPER